MRLSLSDLVAYVAADERLHIWTSVGILILGLVLIYVTINYFRSCHRASDMREAYNNLQGKANTLQGQVNIWQKFFGPFPWLYENSPESETGHDHNDRTVAIDMDGVIFEFDGRWPGLHAVGPVIPGAIESMNLLKSLGYKLAIYTTRNNCMSKTGDTKNVLELTALVQAHLEKAGIPYDYIALMKPLARYYIDDRAIRFKTWRDTLLNLRHLEYQRNMNRAEDIDRVISEATGHAWGQQDE